MARNFTVGDWLVQPDLNRLSRKGQEPVHIEPKFMEVLLCLARHPGQVLSKEEIIQSVWADTFVTDDVLVRAISELRKVFADDAKDPRFILTVQRKGYCLIAPVSEISNASELETSGATDNGTAGKAFADQSVSRVEGRASTFWKRLTAGVGVALAILFATALWWDSGFLSSMDSFGPPRIVPLTTYPEIEGQASLCPDGDHVVFFRSGHWFRGDLWIKQVGFEEAKPFHLTNSGWDHSPAWSPDHHTIAFMRTVGSSEVVMSKLSLDGPERPLITVKQPGRAIGSSLVWSPNGHWLVIYGYPPSDEGTGLIAFSPKTGQVRKLTRTSAPYRYDYSPAFSPDGRRLAFIRFAAPTGFAAVFVLNLDENMRPKGEPLQVTGTKDQILGLTWVSDEELIYGAGIIPRLNLWRLKVSEPYHPELLVFAGTGVARPAFSHQAHRLVYEQFIAEKSIWRISLNENGDPIGKPGIFVSSSSRWDEGPQFSPDGERIVFMSDRSGTQEIWSCTKDGGDLRKLTSIGGVKVRSGGWSPDGKKILFSAQVKGQGEIHIIDLESNFLRNLTNHPADDAQPSWSLDGKSVFFMSDREPGGLWKMPAVGGKATKVEAREIGDTANGEWIFYAGESEAWKVHRASGQRIVIPELQGSYHFHRLVRNRIYFIATVGRTSLRPFSIQCYDIETGELRTLVEMDQHFGSGFAVSPDGSAILYGVFDRTGQDLMLVENFR